MALLLQHPRIFLRMRWLMVKLLSLAIVIPFAHFYCSHQMSLLRQAYAAGAVDQGAATRLSVALVITLAGAIWVVILGRLKPQLGQNWAKAYPVDNAAIG